MKNWSLCNVVWYDGHDAFVSKFVLRCDENGNADDDSWKALNKYLNGNGDVVYVDAQQKLDLEDICDMRHSEDAELSCAFERFNNMFFSWC